MVQAILNLLIFSFGAAIGSFLNVVVYRLPAALSLLWPPSHCPRCRHRLGPTENVPVLGWLWLRGRCRWCKTPISPRYPLVEAATGCLFVLVFWQFGWSYATLGNWLFLSWLLTLSLIDLDTMTLPNVLTQPGLVVGLGFQALLGWHATGWPGFASGLFLAIASAALGIWLFDGIRIGGSVFLGQEAMGDGDPLLAAAIAAWLGWPLLLLTGFLACGIGAVGGGLAIALGWLQRRQAFPFGPFLALGAVLSLFWGEKMVTAYLNLFFPVY
ncbi:MAG: prepilin peptidase [Chloroflexaceae bacterium]|nr:prepilin peptidase [Chloroflexaceae bacterium]